MYSPKRLFENAISIGQSVAILKRRESSFFSNERIKLALSCLRDIRVVDDHDEKCEQS